MGWLYTAFLAQSSNQQWADHLTDSSLFTYIRKAFRFVSEKEQMREEEYQHRIIWFKNQV